MNSLTALLDLPDGQSLIEFPFDGKVHAESHARAIARILGADLKMFVVHKQGYDTIYSQKNPDGRIKKLARS